MFYVWVCVRACMCTTDAEMSVTPTSLHPQMGTTHRVVSSATCLMVGRKTFKRLLGPLEDIKKVFVLLSSHVSTLDALSLEP